MMTHLGAHTQSPLQSLSLPRLLSAGALLGTLLLTSCVSRARYDEALEEIKFYQREYQDLEAYQPKLQAENARLKGELELLRNGAPIEAGATDDIDARLEELRGIMSGMGSTPGDVTVVNVEGGYGIRLTDAILFDSGSTDIKPEGRDLLLKMASEISSGPYERVWVRGHTDSDPVAKPATLERFPHGNLQLSSARAIEVAVLLATAGGIEQQKLVVAGFGPNDAVAPNTSVENKRQNRRVEIFVIEDANAPGAR